MKKRIIFPILFLLACGISSEAQSLLVNTLKPSEQKNCVISEDQLQIGGQTCSNSFYLKSPDGGLIASQEQSAVSYNLKGLYSKLTFVMGPASPNPNGLDGSGILVVLADGKTLLDEVVHCYDEVRYVTLDVSGVKTVTFKHIKGTQDIGVGVPKLWKAGQKAVVATNPMDKLPKGRIKLVEQLKPYFMREGGYTHLITKDESVFWNNRVESISINRKEFDSGLEMFASQNLAEGSFGGWSFFWLNKRYEKLSFIVGPRDNQSKNVTAWLIVKADGKTIYEEIVRQSDLARQVVLDVSGKEQVSFICERRSGDILGDITFGIVDIYAYPEGYTELPEEGEVSLNKEKIAALPDVCPLMSNIRPFSVRGFNDAYNTLFYGESKHYHFSMGGLQYWEGMLFTTGNNLINDNISSYAEYDLAGEFDYMSFDVGCLTKKHSMNDDKLRIYADDQLVFDQTIYCTWPNQHIEVPLYKCHKLRFEKPGTGDSQQTIIGVGDAILYRGNPVENDIFVHETPDCPYTADLIDLCGAPYFHYCGRFASIQTNFDMDDCFHDGSTKREYFSMKDGSQIFKGFMLETNIPLPFENATLMDAVFMFVCGAGAAISSSAVSAVTGISAGAPAGMSALLLGDSDHQSSAAAFNPFGEYESCTFTVANAYEHVDSFDEVFGNTSEEAVKNSVKLNVFADQRLVGEYWLDNKMDPMTVTVPIFKCHQLMFWLECGDQRSGQYVFYDLSVSKESCNLPIPESYSSSTEQEDSGVIDKSSKKKKREKKELTEEEKQERREKAANAVGTGIGILNALFGSDS